MYIMFTHPISQNLFTDNSTCLVEWVCKETMVGVVGVKVILAIPRLDPVSSTGPLVPTDN